MRYTLLKHIIVPLILVSFALPLLAKASTVCYPDGCATVDESTTKESWDALFGNKSTLSAVLNAMTQWASKYDPISTIKRNAAGNITFVGCDNSHSYSILYNCSYEMRCDGNMLVDYCGNSQLCEFGCSNNACNCPLGYVTQNGACVFAGCPTGYTLQGNRCVAGNRCAAPPYCQANDVRDGCTGDVLQHCTWGCAAGSCTNSPNPTATINAIPSLVHTGETTKVSWSAQNVSSCTVTGTNGDSWTSISSSGTQSRPIRSQTIFTLNCLSVAGASPASISRNAIVNIAPIFGEK